MTAWTCDQCLEETEGVSVGDMKRAGVYAEADDPDVECWRCGNRPPEITRLRLTIARAAAQSVAPREALAVAPRRRKGAGILSKRATAEALGVGQDTLAKLVEDGQLAPVPKGTRQGFRSGDVEALVAKGFKLPSAAARPAPRKRQRKPPEKDAASITARLAEF